jgi:predicted amidohydrolase
MTRGEFTVAVAQIRPRLGDVETNLALYEERARVARGLGTDVLVFPELSLTGYFLKDMVSTVALRLDSPEVKRLAALSRKGGKAGTSGPSGLIAGLVEETDDYHFYNSAVYFENGAIVHVHRKAYLPTYGLFDEGRYFARGDRIRSFDAGCGRSAILICEDMWHPSTVYLAALDHALTVFCPSTSPLRGVTDAQPQDNNARYWELLNSMYAQTFSLFIVYANRVGFEDGVGFWGGSEVVDPNGVRLAKAKYYDEDLIAAQINLKTARRQRVVSPLLRDENLDLTINELLRIRGRDLEACARAQLGEAVPGTPAAVPHRGKIRGSSMAAKRRRRIS